MADQCDDAEEALADTAANRNVDATPQQPKAKPSYATGYKKPPRQTQFKKGQSGNPSGRPKGKRNFATVMNDVLHQPVTITENGRQRQVPKFEAAIMQLSNKAASGDMNAMRLLIRLVPGIEQQIALSGHAKLSHESDRMVLEDLMKSLAGPDIQVIDYPDPVSVDPVDPKK